MTCRVPAPKVHPMRPIGSKLTAPGNPPQWTGSNPVNPIRLRSVNGPLGDFCWTNIMQKLLISPSRHPLLLFLRFLKRALLIHTLAFERMLSYLTHHDMLPYAKVSRYHFRHPCPLERIFRDSGRARGCYIDGDLQDESDSPSATMV